MTDLERFETVLAELAQLWLRLGDLAEHFLVVGGQVIALEARERGGDGVIAVETEVGTTVERGYSLDLDLLYDGEAGSMAERIPEVLRGCGFERTTSYRWTKKVGVQKVDIDLLATPDANLDELPTAMTLAPGGDVAVAKPRRVRLTPSSTVAIPSALGFLALKLAAKQLRPTMTKDSFDLFAYVHLMSAPAIAAALKAGGADGERIRAGLRSLFGREDSAGVLDVLSYAASLEAADRALLARSVVDLMSAATAG